MCSRKNKSGCCNSPNAMGTAVTFGIGAAIGAVAYYFFNSPEEPQSHSRQRSRERSRSSSSCSSNTNGQSNQWRQNDNGQNRPDTCSICLENIPRMSARVLLGCGHEFHSTCIKPWLERNANCPVCRQQVE